MSLLESAGNIFKEIFIIVLSIFLIIFAYPLLLVFLLPCWIIKNLIKYLVKRDPKFGNTLDGICGGIAGQDPYLKPELVIVPYTTLADKLDVPKVVQIINDKIIKPGLYPKLQQKIVRKYGYHFWHSVDNFKVEDHVHYLKPDCQNMPITAQELRELTNGKLARLPFDPEKSPWEILVVPHYICDRDPEAKSVFIMRLNHCLMDGYSMFNFESCCANKPWISKVDVDSQNRKLKISIWQSLYLYIILFLTGPYYFLKLFGIYTDKHEFVNNLYKPNFEDKWNSQCTSFVSSERLKAIRMAHGVSMSSLLITLFAQALYKTMERKGLTNLKSSIIHGFITIPLPGHPGTMTNHWSTVRMPINVNSQDPSATLQFVETEFYKTRKSVSPWIFPICNKIVTIVPLWLRPAMNSVRPTSFVVSNFPGPVEPTDIFGCRIRQLYCGANGKDGIGSMLCVLSSCGNFWFDCGSPVCNLPTQKDADDLSNEILETLTALEKKNE